MEDNRYHGGKGQLYQQIISLIPPHQTYIEPFAGGGAILRNKLPAPTALEQTSFLPEAHRYE